MSITAFLAQDIFGGKVYGILRKGGNYHCYNVVGDSVFDLTSEQFGDEVLSYEDNQEQFREVHFAKEEKLIQIGQYLESKLLRIGDDFVNIAKAVMTSEIRRDLINLQGFKFHYFDSDKFPRQRLTEIEKVINRQISGILDKDKMYTVEVFPHLT